MKPGLALKLFVDQAGLQLTILLPWLLCAGITGMYRYSQLLLYFRKIIS
jgi:hypothetical protein